MSAPVTFREPINGNYLFYLEPSWNWTKRSWEYTADSSLGKVAQTIAKMTLIPFLMIATFELIFKHIPCLVINAGVAFLNGAHALLIQEKKQLLEPNKDTQIGS